MRTHPSLLSSNIGAVSAPAAGMVDETQRTSIDGHHALVTIDHTLALEVVGVMLQDGQPRVVRGA